MAKAGRESYLPLIRDLRTVVLHHESAEMAEKYPALYQLLCHAKRDDRFRAGARFTLFAEDGRIKCSIWDPDSHSVWFATLEGFEGALEAVEQLLQQRRGEWRESKANSNGRK